MATTIPFKKNFQIKPIIIRIVIWLAAIVIVFFYFDRNLLQMITDPIELGQRMWSIILLSILLIMPVVIIQKLIPFLRKTPALVIDETGVVSNIEFTGLLVLIKTQDIKNTSITTNGSDRFLHIFVNNPMDYYNRISNTRIKQGFKNTLAKQINEKKGLLIIPQSAVEENLDAIQRLIQEKLHLV